MSYPTKEIREKCWSSRDKYWSCLDEEDPKECEKLRDTFVANCPSQWVKHFDRKRDYLLFKDRVEKEGYDPIEAKNASTK